MQKHLIAWSLETHNHDAETETALFYCTPKCFTVITAIMHTGFFFDRNAIFSLSTCSLRLSGVSKWLWLYEHCNGLSGVHAPHSHQQPTYRPHAHPARHCGRLESNRIRHLWHSGQVSGFYPFPHFTFLNILNVRICLKSVSWGEKKKKLWKFLSKNNGFFCCFSCIKHYIFD